MPATSPRRLSSTRVFTFVNKKPPSPTLFSAQKTGESALDSHKNAYFCGSETASGEGKTGARQSLSPQIGKVASYQHHK